MWKRNNKGIILSAFLLILIIGSSAGMAAELCLYSEESFQATVNSAFSEKALCSIDFVFPGKLVVNSDTLVGDEQSGIVTGSAGNIPLADFYSGEFPEPDLLENLRNNPFKKEEDSGLKRGECLKLEDGYALMVSDFSTEGDKSFVKLLKKGEVLEEYILEAGNTYYVTGAMPGQAVGDEYIEDSGTRYYAVGSGLVVGDKYTLRTGENLTLNDGYALTLLAVDKYGNEALLSLSKNGVPLDEKIVEAGEHYYYNRSASGENKVIIDLMLSQVFLGAVDSIAQVIFEGQYSDTGTVDTNPVVILRPGDELELENAYSLRLEDVSLKSESCLINLEKNNVSVDRRVSVEGESYIYQRKDVGSGNIKTILEVPLSDIFNSDSLQCVELKTDYTIFSDENTVDISPVVFMNYGDSWDLGDGYVLEINEISRNTRALASLMKDNKVVDQDVLEGESAYQYFRKTSGDGSLRQILDISVNNVFCGKITNCVEFSSDYIRNSDLNTLALDDKIILEKLEQLELDEGYVLNPETIDLNGNKALFLLTKDGLNLDEQILSAGSNYYYIRSINGLNLSILTFKLEKAFMGEENRLVIIKDLEQNSDQGLVPESSIQPINRESAEIRSPVYSGQDLQAVLDSNGGYLRINGRNFADFYYNLKNGAVGEELYILQAGAAREIAVEGLVYMTTVQKNDYEYEGWADEQYDLLGFLGELFVPFAGSPDKLAPLLLDDDEKYILQTGEILDLGYGYGLEAKQIDVEGEKIWVQFTKDGEFMDDAILDTTDPEHSSWEVDLDDIEDEDDVVVFRVHVNDILTDEEMGKGFAQIQGLWLIDYDKAFTFEWDDEFGVFEIDTIGYNYLQLTNPHSIPLYKDWEQELAGDLKFKVADDDELSFYLCEEYTAPGTYEVDGEIAEGALAHQWTGLNFAALHYNPDTGVASENLAVNSINGRQVPEGNMLYSTASVESEFECGAWGYYQALWFLADEYLAGYTGNTGFVGEDIGLISEGKLCKVLQNNADGKFLYAGSSLSLSENYSLNIVELDINGNTAWVQLEKNGSVLEDAFISSNEDYVYETDISTIEDVPLIAVHFGNMSDDGGITGVFIEGVFQISESCIEVKPGDTSGKMQITSVSVSGISMKNQEPVNLNRDSIIPITDNIRFRVADSDTLRFYPFVYVEILPALETYLVVDDDQPADYSSIQDAVDNAAPGATILVKPGTYVENVHVDKSLTISSVPGSEDNTNVQAATQDHVFHLTADKVNIRGFNIIGQSGNCGILLDGVKNCNIDKNKLSNNEFGIKLYYSSKNKLTYNVASNNDYGIYLKDSSNNTLNNNMASKNDGCGIYLGWYSSNNTLIDNMASNNNYGIYLSYSSNNTMRNNIMSNNKFNFQAPIYTVSDIDTSNTVDGKPIYYLVDISDIVIDSSSNAGTIYCINCQNISLNNLTLKNNTFGVSFYNTSNSNVNNSTAVNNGYGIHFHSSSNNTLNNNKVHNNVLGISLEDSSNIMLSNNMVNSNSQHGIFLGRSSNIMLSNNMVNLNSYFGISLEYSSNSILSNNTALNNSCGIIISKSMNNTCSYNTVSSNDYGIALVDTGNTSIYNNYFNNINNTYFGGINAGNVWNITRTGGTNIIGGLYIGGNFWATPNGTGFSQTHNDSDGDGICEEVYDLRGGNIDYLPLIMPQFVDWDPWDDSDSPGGEAITTPEIQEAVYCWLNDVHAPETGAEITTVRLQEVITLWLES